MKNTKIGFAGIIVYALISFAFMGLFTGCTTWWDIDPDPYDPVPKDNRPPLMDTNSFEDFEGFDTVVEDFETVVSNAANTN